MLINDILDLSKIESGTTALELSPSLASPTRSDDVERTFRQLAAAKGTGVHDRAGPEAAAHDPTDHTRLQQILKNLLSNAFKFTDTARCSCGSRRWRSGWCARESVPQPRPAVIAFAVTDTGVGIPDDKHALIFEAFQQADMDTSRRFGGTGLGLSISREICRLLGGEITLDSAPGEGSTFTLFLPLALRARNGAPAQRRPATRMRAPTRSPSRRCAHAERDRCRCCWRHTR